MAVGGQLGGSWPAQEVRGGLRSIAHCIPTATATAHISSGAQVPSLIALRHQEHRPMQG